MKFTYFFLFFSGPTLYNTLVKLIATLLILKKLSLLQDNSFPVVFNPKIFLSDNVPISPPKYTELFRKAVHFAVVTDKTYPSLYSQLELGHNWESAIQKLETV